MKYFIILAFLAVGCAPVYVPNARNSPLFTKGGEFQGSIGFGNGLDLQSAVSVSNHIGLMANYSFQDRRSSPYSVDDPNDDYHYHQFLEGGIGYFDSEGKWAYEVFAGYGRGEASSYDSYTWWGSQNQQATGEYERYFIQPAFGLNKKIVHVSFVPRIVLVDFNQFSNDLGSYNVHENPRLFFEPAVLGRVNLMDNHFLLNFQAGFSVPASSNLYYEYRPFQFSTGIGFRIGGIKKEKVQE